MRRLTPATLVAFFALAGTAQATALDGHPRIERWRQVAASAFPVPACPHVTVTEGAPSDTSFGAQAWFPCEVRLRPDWQTWDRSFVCTTLSHEYGHLAGHAHSPDPNSVMFFSPEPRTLPACARAEVLEAALTYYVPYIISWHRREAKKPERRAKMLPPLRRLLARRANYRRFLGP